MSFFVEYHNVVSSRHYAPLLLTRLLMLVLTLPLSHLHQLDFISQRWLWAFALAQCSCCRSFSGIISANGWSFASCASTVAAASFALGVAAGSGISANGWSFALSGLSANGWSCALGARTAAGCSFLGLSANGWSFPDSDPSMSWSSLFRRPCPCPCPCRFDLVGACAR